MDKELGQNIQEKRYKHSQHIESCSTSFIIRKLKLKYHFGKS